MLVKKHEKVLLRPQVWVLTTPSSHLFKGSTQPDIFVEALTEGVKIFFACVALMLRATEGRCAPGAARQLAARNALRARRCAPGPKGGRPSRRAGARSPPPYTRPGERGWASTNPAVVAGFEESARHPPRRSGHWM